MGRLSDTISEAQALNIWEAICFANELGMPLNRFVTILWEQAETVGRVGDSQARFFERMRKWTQYWNMDAAWVWVTENGSEMGLHSHMLVHIGSENLVPWRRMLPRWIDGDVDRRTIQVTTVAYPGDTDTRLNRARGVAKYILKGVDSQGASILDINPLKQGLVPGKRAGTSQNIGRAARRRYREAISKPGGANLASAARGSFPGADEAVERSHNSNVLKFPEIPTSLSGGCGRDMRWAFSAQYARVDTRVMGYGRALTVLGMRRG